MRGRRALATIDTLGNGWPVGTGEVPDRSRRPNDPVEAHGTGTTRVRGAVVSPFGVAQPPQMAL